MLVHDLMDGSKQFQRQGAAAAKVSKNSKVKEKMASHRSTDWVLKWNTIFAAVDLQQDLLT